MKLLHFVIYCSAFLVTAYGDGEVLFMSKPPSIDFRGHEEVDLSVIKEIFSVAMGFTTSQSSEWRGISINDPFNYADAVIGLAIPGVPSLGLTAEHRYPLVTDALLDETWASIESSILERYPYAENQTLVHINLDDGKQEAEVNLGKGKLELKPFSGLTQLKESVEEHKAFLDQLSLLNAISDKINEVGVVPDGIQDAYWFELPAFHALHDVEGADSKTVFEAKRLLSSAVLRLTQAFDGVYYGRVLVATLASDVKHTRRFRRQSADTDTNNTNWNLAPVYSSDYAPIFNIMLWFTIAFIMAIIAISMATAGMDPGDSIIYRMTSNRMKKEN